MKLIHATLLAAAILSLQACGGSDDDDSRESGFYAPTYGDARGDTRWQADLSDVTDKVVANQDAGSELASLISAVDDGLVQVFGSYKVKLISASKNSCPQDLEGCDTTDSAALGVGDSALVAGLSELKASVRDQGQRGSCVAFALNGGMEVLLSRQDQDADLSEQNTYFEGKRLTDTWDSAGLSPYDTFASFIGQNTKWVAESYWPYNQDDKFCARYNLENPNATCSETEAQGGGSDLKQQDPSAASAAGYRLTTAHKLYASVGRIKQALYRGYPVAISVNANYDFELATYKGGVVSWVVQADSCGATLCGHEILAVGYQDDDRVEGGGYLIVKNSWSSGWGDDGLAYLTYEWLEHSLLDAQALVEIDAKATK
ncbi:C1 family peptidase [Caldimonas sp. KR1-144]|uniref:C1 family peptidase n=1 Tax=Caldimonas sp. KR1-144 TaxID=3400911 RepID=UPI003C1231B2